MVENLRPLNSEIERKLLWPSPLRLAVVIAFFFEGAGLYPEFPCLENSMSEQPPVPAFLLKNENRPAYKRRSEPSFFFQIAMPIILATAIVAIGAAIGFYWLFANCPDRPASGLP